jgi:hypothetical protein
MRQTIKLKIRMTRIKAFLAVGLTALPALALAGAVQAATLTTASVSLSDPQPSAASVKYDLLASNLTGATTIKCIKVVFTVNADGTGGVPTSFNSSTSASINTAQSTIFSTHTGYALVKTTNGTLTYTNAAGIVPSVTTGAHYVIDGITNGSVVNTAYYMTFSTFNNTDCATSPIDNVTTGFIYTNGQQVSISVDPSLSFSVAGIAGTGANTVNGTTLTNALTTTSTTIPFGSLTAASNKVAAQDLTVSTNSGLGYTVATRYTAPPTVNSYTISDLAGAPNSLPITFTAAGTEAFGYTTEDATLGTGTAGRFAGNKWAAFTTTNAEVAYNGAPVANQTTRVGFQAGIAGSTEPGAYTTTVIYTATPVY